ncbi:hypothetical protein [Roseateles sp. LKC17W]|uniref:DUF4398 domain-containing protein n=1 Tax=Pelomonas margarita TaxID=3299031 RepID=A0ABW7FIE0_9BURK
MDIQEELARAEDRQNAEKLTAAAALRAARAAAGAAGDTSGNCDAAVHYAERRQFQSAAQELEWAEENARSAMRRIQDARAVLANAMRSAS